MSEYVVELQNVTKRFPGVVALSNMFLQLKPGEIHGLIGENGAGKSTLIKTLMGVHRPEEGTILINGEKQVLRNPNDSAACGISCVYQELNIEPLLSVTDNIFINKWKKNSLGLLDYASMHAKAREVLSSLGLDEVDPSKPAGTFGMGIQQMIEIAKALLINSKVIIMDEPTSSLGEKEVEQLMKTCRQLKERGIAILFVSHKLEELFQLCDRVTIMRDGQHIATMRIEELTHDILITKMVGRTLDNQFPKVEGKRGSCFLKAENLKVGGVLHDVSFEAYGGEILGFSGLVGAGRTETMRAIFGADPLDGGKVYIHGKEEHITQPKHAVRKGIAFLTEDRKGQGLVLSQTIRNNLILANLRRFSSRFGFLKEKEIDQACQESIEGLRIKTPSANEIVGQLSGGNQQKVVIGKWGHSNADIYIFDEPTRGIDVGAKVEVYNVMNRLVQEGKCVIMISSEMPEVLGMSDRVVVMRKGRVMATIDRKSKHFNQDSIMHAAWGGKLDEE